jgi:DNA-binding response OmpR family regulator
MNEMTMILIVDDEPDILDNVSLALEAEGYQVLTATGGIEALEVLWSQKVDLILADIAMSNMNGYQLYEKVRQNPHWVTIPFLFLTARTLDSDVRYGKELGVDDYLTKPLRVLDLLATVQGKLRRAKQLFEAMPQVEPSSENELLEIGRLRLEPAQHRVWLGEQELKLSAREFRLLEYLAQRTDRIASSQELIQATHDFNADPIEAGDLLRPLILSIRRKLGSSVGEMGLIENVRGVGYRLIVPN